MHPPVTAATIKASHAVATARKTLAAYDAGGGEDHPATTAAGAAYWAGGISEALRLVLGEIDRAAGQS